MAEENRKDAAGATATVGAEQLNGAAAYDRPKPRAASSAPDGAGEPANLDLLMDVSVPVVAQLGSTNMRIRDILRLTPGSIVELDKLAGEPVDLFVRGQLFAQGEVVVVDENFGIRVTKIISPDSRTDAASGA